jgi:hypothetical protein
MEEGSLKLLNGIQFLEASEGGLNENERREIGGEREVTTSLM